jgi:hypothetical protein
MPVTNAAKLVCLVPLQLVLRQARQELATFHQSKAAILQTLVLFLLLSLDFKGTSSHL